MRNTVALLLLIGGAIILAGCGGGGNQVATPAPDAGAQEATVGPFVIQTAASATVDIQSIAHRDGVAFVALSTAGVIDWMGTVEQMERLIFTSDRSGSFQIHRTDFFGNDMVRLTDRAHGADNPQWSPDGKMIAYDTGRPSQDIIVMDANGLNERRLTDDPSVTDADPTWSPDSELIAFVSDRLGSSDIHTMFSSGGPTERIAELVGTETDLHWSPVGDEILYRRQGAIYRVDLVTGTESAVATPDAAVASPTWHPDGFHIAYGQAMGGLGYEVVTDTISGGNPERFAGGHGSDFQPVYSSDGDWLFYFGTRNGSEEIFAKQTSPPYRELQTVRGPSRNFEPDLGSPVPTVTRTLIGPAGADHGYDPVHAHAIAAVAVFDADGYLNFVRAGVPQDQGNVLKVTPLPQSGDQLVGVVISSPKLYYVEQDEGIGEDPTLWDLSGATSRSIVLYFDAETGDLASVLDLDDDTSTVSTAAVGNSIIHEHAGASTTVRGSFRAVYGPDGELVAEGEIGAVEIDAAGGVVRAF